MQKPSLKQINIKLTEKEYELVIMKAKEFNTNPTAYAKLCLLNGIISSYSKQTS